MNEIREPSRCDSLELVEGQIALTFNYPPIVVQHSLPCMRTHTELTSGFAV